MRRRLFLSLMLSISALSSAQAQALDGVTIDRTRVVINGGKAEGTLGVSNFLNKPVLVQTSFLDLKKKKTSAFLASPPLYRLDAQKSNRIRILKVESLPDDVESVFWVQVTFIPTSSTNEQRQMGIGYGQRIKLFYRPKNLQGDCRYVADELKWNYQNGSLSVQNPTKLSISMVKLNLNGQSIDANMLMPNSKFQWKLPNQPLHAFSFQYIDEFGGLRTKEVQLKP